MTLALILSLVLNAVLLPHLFVVRSEAEREIGGPVPMWEIAASGLIAVFALFVDKVHRTVRWWRS